MINKLERKFGRYAIPNLMIYLIGGYVIGYLLYFGSMISNIDFIGMMTLEPYYIIHRLQIWRIITWVMIPPSTSIIWAVAMMVFYYQLGMILERTWGTFRFNLYIFGGILFTIIGSFILYAIYALKMPGQAVIGIGNYFSTSYINMTIFLAFAVMYPEMEVRLYFLIPIRMKWMAIVYAVITLVEVIQSDWGGRVAIIASVLNFIVFFLMTRSLSRVNPKEIHRKNAWKRATRGPQKTAWSSFGQNTQQSGRGPQPVARHKCAICGRTDVTNPELTFRFCSKCHGNYEYCEDHIFNHKHIV